MMSQLLMTMEVRPIMISNNIFSFVLRWNYYRYHCNHRINVHSASLFCSLHLEFNVCFIISDLEKPQYFKIFQTPRSEVSSELNNNFIFWPAFSAFGAPFFSYTGAAIFFLNFTYLINRRCNNDELCMKQQHREF